MITLTFPAPREIHKVSGRVGARRKRRDLPEPSPDSVRNAAPAPVLHHYCMLLDFFVHYQVFRFSPSDSKTRARRRLRGSFGRSKPLDKSPPRTTRYGTLFSPKYQVIRSSAEEESSSIPKLPCDLDASTDSDASSSSALCFCHSDCDHCDIAFIIVFVIGKENSAPCNTVPASNTAVEARVPVPTPASLISNAVPSSAPSTEPNHNSCSFVSSCAFTQPMDYEDSSNLALPPRTDCNLNEDMLYTCYGDSSLWLLLLQDRVLVHV